MFIPSFTRPARFLAPGLTISRGISPMSRSRPVDHNWFMAIRRSRERRPSVMDMVDGALFAFAGLATIWLAYLVFRASIRPGWPMLLLIVFWVLLTYLLLPRLHRILTRMYVPGYFIGRARTSDGLLGDPVNLALRGQEAQVHAAMTRAGWTRADDLSLSSGMRILDLDTKPGAATRGASQPAESVRPPARFRLPTRGCGQPVQTAPRTVLAVS